MKWQDGRGYTKSFHWITGGGCLHFLGRLPFWGCLLIWGHLHFLVVFIFWVVFIFGVIFIFWPLQFDIIIFCFIFIFVQTGSWVEFCHNTIVAIRCSLAMLYAVWQIQQFLWTQQTYTTYNTHKQNHLLVVRLRYKKKVLSIV